MFNQNRKFAYLALKKLWLDQDCSLYDELQHHLYLQHDRL